MDQKLDKEDKVFLNVAKNISKLSHCAKTQVGAIAVRNGRVIASGVNGTPPGHPNCDEIHIGNFDHAAHRLWADDNEIHAEQNVINDAASRGVMISGSTLYVTMQPCKQCTKNLMTAGVKRIVYDLSYDRITEQEKAKTIAFVQMSGVEIEQKPLIKEIAINDAGRLYVKNEENV